VDGLQNKKHEEALTEKNMAYMGCTVQDGRAKARLLCVASATKS